MVDISDFTAAKILDKRSSPSRVEHRYELELWLPTDLVGKMPVGRVRVRPSPCSVCQLILLARCECLKRHGVGEREGELGADFSSIVLPNHSSRILTVLAAGLSRNLSIFLPIHH
jgi:hypothetical protein